MSDSVDRVVRQVQPDGSSAARQSNADNAGAVTTPPLVWTNFARIGECRPQQQHYPASVEEVVELVKRIRSSGSSCRVVGGGKSPNTSTFTDTHLIHMSRMNHILRIDTTQRTITCEGGVVLEDLMQALDAAGLMLRCVPSFVKTTIGGCIATATHSSGIDTHSLSDYVTKVVLVDGTGTIRTYEQESSELALVACHLGSLGVVVEVTLQTEAKSMWCLRSQPVSLTQAGDATQMAKKVANSEYYRFWWVPNTDVCYESFGKRISSEEAQRAKKEEAEAATTVSRWRARAGEALTGDWLRHGVVQRSLRASCHHPSLQPIINKAYQRVFYRKPAVQYGSALESFTFDCLFKQWANEWAIDAEKAPEAFRALQDMINRGKLKVHFPVEFRFCAADTAAMSPANGRKTCWIGIVMYRPFLEEARDTKAYYDGFCEMMTKLGGRPHWAKYFAWNTADVQKAYGDNWTRFLALRKQLDPSDVFVNRWLRHLMSNERHNSTVFVSSKL